MKKNKRSTKDTSEVKKDNTIKVYQRDKIGYTLQIAQPEWTEKQQEYIKLVRDANSKIVFVKGCAGTGKTFINLWLALELLNIGRIQEIVLARSVVESSSIGMGYLPGSQGEKLAPYTEPFMDKLRQLLKKEQIEQLIKEQRIQFIPINFLRGREYNASFIFLDEAQNLTLEELQTLLTRYGKYSKMVIGGDTEQSDLETFRKSKSGFKPLFAWYDKPEAVAKGIGCFKFGIEDIKREPIIGYLVEEYQAFKQSMNSGDYRPGGK